MSSARTARWVVLAIGVCAAVYGAALIRRGFSAADEPSVAEQLAARFVRRLAIPSEARNEKNPLAATPQVLQRARERFNNQCGNCHATTGSGRTDIGQALYPKAPNLRLAGTQSLSDGELRYIIRNGVRLTGMPAWANLHPREEDASWELVLFIRTLGAPTLSQSARQSAAMASAHYVGSQACATCHAQIYDRWKTTPMANVVRDPREHPDAILPDLKTNPLAKFTSDQVALVYGSLWKQRYFTKVGDDYFPEPAQWDVAAKTWRPYFVANGTDWWVPFYPPDNMQRPTGPTCDGCHSVNYDVRTKQVTEWNVGCERCHGPGSEHVADSRRDTIANPSHLDDVQANDTCIQCHSQGRPLSNPIEGRYYDWPVGYRVGLRLSDFWSLEGHVLGQTSFTHYADGTAHKNRMQGNDFVQSLMYRRGVTCFDCHDVHGTSNYAQLRKPANQICLDCHRPNSVNGPRAGTLEEHTHHKDGSTGSQCVACHMPKIETTIANTKVSAHTFAFITPAMTDLYQIPNACTTCHADKTTAWATDAMRRWEGHSPWRTD
jgi:predicted CXXCH cytochrome family protein